MGMTRRALLASTAAIASMGPVGAKTLPGTKGKPNIVVIVADDVGFSDISCFGGEIPTPNIDALGAGGLKFTQFYNCAMCSPSRASLLTGTYPSQAGLGWLEQLSIPDSRGIRGGLLNRVVTFAELLKDQGYATAMAGKWHLGITRGVTPWHRGFERSIVSPQGRMYFPDQTTGSKIDHEIYLDGKLLDIDSPELGKDHWYSADLFVRHGIEYVKDAHKEGKPFLLYLPFVNAHTPLMAPQEAIDRFKDHYKAGWDVLREARFKRQKELGIFGPDEILPPREPNTYDWEKLTPEQQEHFGKIMAVYAAVVERMDKAVGDLVSALKSMGTLDNTLILFMCDNGGNAAGGPDGKLKGDVPGGPHSSVQSGMNWATLQNTPFRYFKRFTEEGGISTPLIAHWPRGIHPNLNNTYVRESGHLIDVMATLLDITGTDYPQTYGGHEIIPLEGRSFAPAFGGQPLYRSRPLGFTLQGNRALRDGRWKLVAPYNRPWSLYDMAVDRSETKDMAASRPDLVFKLAAEWDEWAQRCYVDPWTDKIERMLFKSGHVQNWGSEGKPKIPQAMDSTVTW